MIRRLPVLLVCGLLLTGCGSAESTAPRVNSPPVATTAALTPIEKTSNGLRFDPETVNPGDHGFSTQGGDSVRVIVHGRREGKCRFDYVHFEPTGSYTWRLVEVPISAGPVTINSEEAGIETSFALDQAAVLWSGQTSAIAELRERMKPIPTGKQAILGEEFYANYIRDEVEGSGEEAKEGDEVVIRVFVFCNEYFSELLLELPEPRELRFRVGEGKAGSSLESCVIGMKPGGKRRAMLWADISGAVRKEVGGWQPEKQMAVEIELAEVHAPAWS